jgi:hypothetical protein
MSRFGQSAGRPAYKIPELPEKLIVGYANWNECERDRCSPSGEAWYSLPPLYCAFLTGDEKIVDAVKQGVNVVMWFSINLAVSPNGKPTITNGPDMDCVADRVKEIAALGLPTVHLISIGGWNSPHPDTSISAAEAYEYWNYWNRHIAARPEKGFLGFDGFDWDIEGKLSLFASEHFNRHN